MSTNEGNRLDVDHHLENGRTVLVLSGELDPHTAPLLEESVSAAAGSGEVVLDLAGLEFLDSAGVRAILEVHQRLDAEGRELVLRSPSKMAGRVLEIAGLDQHLRID